MRRETGRESLPPPLLTVTDTADRSLAVPSRRRTDTTSPTVTARAPASILLRRPLLEQPLVTLATVVVVDAADAADPAMRPLTDCDTTPIRSAWVAVSRLNAAAEKACEVPSTHRLKSTLRTLLDSTTGRGEGDCDADRDRVCVSEPEAL